MYQRTAIAGRSRKSGGARPGNGPFFALYQRSLRCINVLCAGSAFFALYRGMALAVPVTVRNHWASAPAAFRVEAGTGPSSPAARTELSFHFL
jgi:hypothetical protein